MYYLYYLKIHPTQKQHLWNIKELNNLNPRQVGKIAMLLLK